MINPILMRAAEARQLSLENLPDYQWLQLNKIVHLIKLMIAKGKMEFMIDEKLYDENLALLNLRGFTVESVQDPILTTAWKTTISW